MAFIVLRVLSYFNRKRRRISVNGEQRDIPTSKLRLDKNLQCQRHSRSGKNCRTSKENMELLLSQEAGASVSMHGASGFGMYGMDVLVETDEVKRHCRLSKLQMINSRIRKKFLTFLLKRDNMIIEKECYR